jgi:hypothetical protein
MKAKPKIVFKNGYAVGFKMAVADCFRDSIKKKAFNAGDMIYDDKRAYLSPWSKAVKHIDYAFRVVSMEGKNITYDILVRAPKKKSLIKLSVAIDSIKDFLEKLKIGIDLSKKGKSEATQIVFKLS